MWTVSSLQQSVGKLTMKKGGGGGIPAQSWHHASSKQRRQQAGTNKQGDPELLTLGQFLHDRKIQIIIWYLDLSDYSGDCGNRVTWSAFLDRSSYLIMGSQIKALRFLPKFIHFVLLHLHMDEKQTVD